MAKSLVLIPNDCKSDPNCALLKYVSGLEAKLASPFAIHARRSPDFVCSPGR